MSEVHCENCGAPLTLNPDGSVPGCPYCGAGVPEVVNPAALAASLGGELSDVKKLVESLAGVLDEPGFAAHGGVERSGFIWKHVSAVRLQVHDHQYRLEVGDRGQAIALRSKMVRGVALKNEELPLAQWLEEFGHALNRVAAESEAAREAVQRFSI